tara:strand:+ start:1274 stop:3793 length:2520 start_codon:yes stop_codon:yes gene_type:complete
MSILPASGIGDESTGFYNGVAERSLRFNGSNHYLTRQSSTAPNFAAGNQKTWTCSFWIKKTKFGSTVMLLSTIVNNANEFNIYINSTGYFSVGTQTTTLLQSSEALLDPTNWYNLIVRMDTTQSSDTNKLRLYINGNEASYSTDNRSSISENDDLGLLSGINHYYGGRSNGTMFYDGYMAELNVVDGSSLGPTSFGELKNGTWIPVEYSSSYGTQGWRLQFINTTLNSSGAAGSSSTVGADTSGNGNHWQAENITADDINMADSPENNFCILNPLAAGDVNDMSQGALQYADNRTGGTAQAIGTFPLSSGKWYWEVHYDYDPGASNMIGIVAVEEITGSHTDTDAIIGYGNFFGWDERGIYYYSGGSTSSKTSYAAGDVVSFAMDVDAGKLFIRKNDGSFEDSGNPVNGTNPSYTFTANTVMVPHVQNYKSSRHIFNFGQNQSFNGDGSITAGTETDSNGKGLFKYAPPTDYLAICAANLPDTTISPSKSSQADDHFDTDTYAGSSSNQTRTLNFQADWLWFKERTTDGIQPQLFDSSRAHASTGTKLQSRLESNGSLSETDSVAIQSQSGNDIVLLGGVSTTNDASSRTYVVWHWKANGGTTSSNTDGDITSTVQANTTAGFSIVTYTGTGTQSDTVGHGLGKKPAWVLVKSRSEAQNWHVYHQGLDSSAPHNYTIFLNATNARASSSSNYWGGSAPTTSVIGVGNDNSSNKSSTTYVMYCFAEIEGYSKFGNYTGNGSTDGKYVYTGFRPAFVMIKRYNGTGNWFMMDNKRLGYNPNNYRLLADSNLKEYTSTSANIIDIFSNGFKCRTTSSNTNGDNDTYIYMAFAEQPFQFSNAR